MNIWHKHLETLKAWWKHVWREGLWVFFHWSCIGQILYNNNNPPVGLSQLWCDFDKSSTFRNQTYNESASIPDICFYPEVRTKWGVWILQSGPSVVGFFSPLFATAAKWWIKHPRHLLAPRGRSRLRQRRLMEPSERHAQNIHYVILWAKYAADWWTQLGRNIFIAASSGWLTFCCMFTSQHCFILRVWRACLCGSERV